MTPLEVQLKRAEDELNRVLSRSSKTGMNAQAEAISKCQKQIKKLKTLIQEKSNET